MSTIVHVFNASQRRDVNGYGAVLLAWYVAVCGCSGQAQSVSQPAIRVPANTSGALTQREAEHVAGIAYFQQLANRELEYPSEYQAVLHAAAAATRAFCSHAYYEAGYHCGSTTRALLDQLIRPAPNQPIAPATAINVTGAARCEDFAKRWAATYTPTNVVDARRPPLHVSITGCTVQIQPNENTGYCVPTQALGLQRGVATCPDGSVPQQQPNECQNGQPCQPSPLACPCTRRNIRASLTLQGVWNSGELSGPFTRRFDHFDEMQALAPHTLPSPPDEATIRDTLFAQTDTVWHGGALLRAAQTLDVLRATTADEIALRCATWPATGEDILGLTSRVAPRCATAYLRPAKFTRSAATATADITQAQSARNSRSAQSKSPPQAPPPPRVETARYPYKVHHHNAAARAAIIEHLRAAFPTVELSLDAAGFIQKATLTPPNQRRLDDLTAFVKQAWPYLGFTQMPTIEPRGATYYGPAFDLATATQRLSVETTAQGFAFSQHVWPVTCEALTADAKRARLQQFIASEPRSLELQTPGAPCDPRQKRCTSNAPRTLTVPLTAEMLTATEELHLDQPHHTASSADSSAAVSTLRCVLRVAVTASRAAQHLATTKNKRNHTRIDNLADVRVIAVRPALPAYLPVPAVED